MSLGNPHSSGFRASAALFPSSRTAGPERDTALIEKVLVLECGRWDGEAQEEDTGILKAGAGRDGEKRPSSC